MTEKHAGGRPSIYTPELAAEICHKIATQPKSIKVLCKENNNFPNPDTIFTWKREKQEFSDLYARAKRDQIEVLVDEILDISDDKSDDYYTNSKGEDVFDSEHVQRSRLKIDTRKWYAAKLAPKIYGDKIMPDEKESNGDEINADRELLHKCKAE